MDKADIMKFCSPWLEAWTGNQPEKLITFYSEHVMKSISMYPNSWQLRAMRDLLLPAPCPNLTSHPRRRVSKGVKRLDTRLRGYDGI